MVCISVLSLAVSIHSNGREMDNYPEGEKSEMVELYESRGVSHEDATRLIEILSRHKDVFVDTMMVEELGIMPPEDEDPWRIGLMTFASFVFFGAANVFSVVMRSHSSQERCPWLLMS